MKLLSFIFLMALPMLGQAQQVMLAWDRAITHTNLSEFTLRWGTNSGIYPVALSIPPNLTTGTVVNLARGRNYFFVVTARNVQGLDSDPYNELAYRTPGPSGLPGKVLQFAINKVP